jgi:GGDEF domain-containing protein
MCVDALEHGLLKRSLTDPATGLPNRLYLDVIRSWEETRAKRDGAKVLLLALAANGGTEQLRRMLAVRLCAILRNSDLIASDGWESFLLLCTVRATDDVDTIKERIAHATKELNEGLPPEVALKIDVEVRAAA